MRISGRVRKLATLLRVAQERKHMVIMIGGPASGKGYHTREGGKSLEELTQGIIDADEVPKEETVKEESDNSLRILQREAAKEHHRALVAAKKEGTCDKVLEDHWYLTKDGSRKTLGDATNCDDIPDDFNEYFKKGSGTYDFYISMRGWHDDAAKKHTSPPAPPELAGKPVERFKDRARTMFERRVQNMVESGDADLLILDSAGEDIDTQDFEGQIARAKANGYEVTVVHLDIDPADTKLTNRLRGAKGNRMVDESDIDNYFATEKKELKSILGADPSRYIHMKRTGDPLTDAERGEVSDLIDQMQESRLAGASADELKAIEKNINKFLHRPQYQVQFSTSQLNSVTKKKVQEIESAPPASKADEDKGGDSQESGDGEIGPQYDLYVQRKKDRGEKPLDQEAWEARVNPKAASDRIRSLARMASKTGLEKVMEEVMEDVQKELGKDYEGYKLEYDLDDLDFYVRIKDGNAAGIRDITALKDIRKRTHKLFEKLLKAYDDAYEPRITAASRGDDLIISYSIDYS